METRLPGHYEWRLGAKCGHCQDGLADAERPSWKLSFNRITFFSEEVLPHFLLRP